MTRQREEQKEREGGNVEGGKERSSGGGWAVRRFRVASLLDICFCLVSLRSRAQPDYTWQGLSMQVHEQSPVPDDSWDLVWTIDDSESFAKHRHRIGYVCSDNATKSLRFPPALRGEGDFMNSLSHLIITASGHAARRSAGIDEAYRSTNYPRGGVG
ncbi:hypothetical protein N7510_007580 [Penicillium lagena]|uniref:uncharacterized protein n=1 Tax=Penicillium lagena TaxID=94218 RepID=UPI00253FB39D|nr:uncharacterized protein N7510_007580 [Penicillium lagena]KAJ5610861.1 hypothetical protein N7510_007580 [Penicillium lagena]